MLDHVSIGVRDIERSCRFYDRVLATLGYHRKHTNPEAVGYASERADFWLNPTATPVPEDMGSGLHFCFLARSTAEVDRFHAEGLAAGGRDNGAPGLRPQYGPTYYGSFVIDPDGYRIEAYCEAT
jgi:catechol 2,3-dioxygenase-like lactoylglutathione lyase family enzyme